MPDSVVQSAYALGCSKATPFVRWYFRPAAGNRFGMILGGCYAMGATAPVMFTGAVAYASVPHSLLARPCLCRCIWYLLLSQGATSMPAVWDSICDDGADSSGKYGGGCLCGALSERVGKVGAGMVPADDISGG